jgi:hypothetical protein
MERPAFVARVGTTFLPNLRSVTLFALGVLSILPVAGQTQSIHDLFGTDEFHRAYFAANTHEITFEGFQELNWEAKARTALPWLNLDRPTKEQIGRLSTFESAGPQFRSIDFDAPLEATVNRLQYLLISADGITGIKPVRLKGSVNFDFDANLTAVERKVVSGVVVGEPARPVTSAAFVIIGRPGDVRDIRPGARFKKRNQSGPTVYDFIEDNHNVSWTIASSEQLDAASALSFRLGNRQYLLAKWNSDFCGSSYTLFSVDGVLKPIAGNDYDCDP